MIKVSSCCVKVIELDYDDCFSICFSLTHWRRPVLTMLERRLLVRQSHTSISNHFAARLIAPMHFRSNRITLPVAATVKHLYLSMFFARNAAIANTQPPQMHVLLSVLSFEPKLFDFMVNLYVHCAPMCSNLPPELSTNDYFCWWLSSELVARSKSGWIQTRDIKIICFDAKT